MSGRPQQQVRGRDSILRKRSSGCPGPPVHSTFWGPGPSRNILFSFPISPGVETLQTGNRIIPLAGNTEEKALMGPAFFYMGQASTFSAGAWVRPAKSNRPKVREEIRGAAWASSSISLSFHFPATKVGARWWASQAFWGSARPGPTRRVKPGAELS